MATSIDSVVIPDNTVWLDEYVWAGVTRQSTRTIAGNIVTQVAAKSGGRPITLDLGWVAKSTLTSLEALRDSTTTTSFTVTFPDTTTMTCGFAPVDDPIKASPIQPYAVTDTADYYETTVYLVEIV